MKRLVLVLGDQLTESLAGLAAADPGRDLVVMAEVGDEATYVRHHPKKIAFLFTAMRKFAERLRALGWAVAYSRLDDPDNTGSIAGELARHRDGHDRVLVTRPGEWRLIAALDSAGIPVEMVEDDRFLCTPAAFARWAEGRKSLRMEHFYREMRRRTGLLMDGDAPAGGKWNYDHDNRKPASTDMFRPAPRRFEPDRVTEEVLDMVAARFPDHFGELRPFWFATDREQALEALDHFVKESLAEFGPYQDAMLQEDKFLNHAVLSPYLNAGLLAPLEVCGRVAEAWRVGEVPINSAEGFIRQIIGWREFMRGIYFLEGPDYVSRNELGHFRDLPAAYWGGETRMNCVACVVRQTREEAYAHHIQRLMVTGNFALLAGIDPGQVHQWYLAVYIDAYEWVEAPNVIGMSQFADGGVVASKPYVSSGAYIDRMSDYCKSCAYDVKARTGASACPFNLLYWDFLIRHRDRFATNPRMVPMYRTWDRMDAHRRDAVREGAGMILARLDRGKAV